MPGWSEDEQARAKAAEGPHLGAARAGPGVTVTGGSNKRVRWPRDAAKEGQQPRPSRARSGRRRDGDKRKGHRDGLRPALDAAHQQLGGPPCWSGITEHARQPGDAELVAARDWLTARAPALLLRAESGRVGLGAAEKVLVNLVKRNLAELTALVKTRLRRMQYRPELLAAFLARTRLTSRLVGPAAAAAD